LGDAFKTLWDLPVVRFAELSECEIGLLEGVEVGVGFYFLVEGALEVDRLGVVGVVVDVVDDPVEHVIFFAVLVEEVGLRA
jgi:hypothetical protein